MPKFHLSYHILMMYFLKAFSLACVVCFILLTMAYIFSLFTDSFEYPPLMILFLLAMGFIAYLLLNISSSEIRKIRNHKD